MGEVAIVTGAGRGIGAAIADTLVTRGFNVARLSLEDEPENVTEATAGNRTSYYQCDITDVACHNAMIERIASDLGEPTCLVNNAGVTSLQRGDMLDLGPEGYDRTMAINLRGGFFLTQTFARRRLALARTEERASIIFIGSVNAEIIGESRADYCLSKAGVAMMSKLFAARLAGHGIAVFEIRPGVIRTEMTRPASARYDALIEAGGIPMRRWGEPEDVAQAVAVLATGSIPYATGIHLDIGGGLQLHRV